MKAAPAKVQKISIAVVESDPLRFIGLRSLFDSESDLELTTASLVELADRKDVDLVLLGSRNGQNLFDLMAGLKASRPLPTHPGGLRNYRSEFDGCSSISMPC